MTSKEALEELKIYLPAIYSEVAKCLNTIKQDLERLEQLEKENQELKDKIEISQKANKELSFTLNAYVKAQKPYIEKIQKLEKAIDILKKRLTIEFDDKYNEINFKLYACKEFDYVYLPFDDKQEYELLKEVLE